MCSHLWGRGGAYVRQALFSLGATADGVNCEGLGFLPDDYWRNERLYPGQALSDGTIPERVTAGGCDLL